MKRSKRSSEIVDGRLLGRMDWFVARTEQGKEVVRKKSDVVKSDVILGGPYETQSQAKCEKGQWSADDLGQSPWWL